MIFSLILLLSIHSICAGEKKLLCIFHGPLDELLTKNQAPESPLIVPIVYHDSTDQGSTNSQLPPPIPKLKKDQLFLLTGEQMQDFIENHKENLSNEELSNFENAARRKDLEWMKYLYNLLQDHDKANCSGGIKFFCTGDDDHDYKSVEKSVAKGYTKGPFERAKQDIQKKVSDLIERLQNFSNSVKNENPWKEKCELAWEKVGKLESENEDLNRKIRENYLISKDLCKIILLAFKAFALTAAVSLFKYYVSQLK